MDELQVAWAAGLFEGEGCLTVSHSGKYQQTRLKLNMTDHDTVERFAAIVGVGSVRQEAVAQEHHKPQWCWYVGNRKDVALVINMLYPYLGERRKSRADELLLLCDRPHGNSVQMIGNRNAANKD